MSGGLGALILAGGAGERLVPLVPRFMKPLREVGGRPLVRHAIDFVLGMRTTQLAIVVNPLNHDAIRDEAAVVRSTAITIVVQEDATGIVDAIHLGLRPLTCRRVVVLCADNTFDPGGTWFANRLGHRATIAVSRISDPAGRLTRLVGGRLEPPIVDEVPNHRWIGPVVVDTVKLRIAVEGGGSIEDVLNRAGAPFSALLMNCRDHGVIDD